MARKSDVERFVANVCRYGELEGYTCAEGALELAFDALDRRLKMVRIVKLTLKRYVLKDFCEVFPSLKADYKHLGSSLKEINRCLNEAKESAQVV